MTFVDSLTSNELRGKLYIHNSEQYSFHNKRGAIFYLKQCIEGNKDRLKNVDYFISLLWSNKKRDQLMDFFVYSDLQKDWGGNPDVAVWQVINGMWRKDENITCGEGLILLGEEEKLRRNTNNLAEYLEKTVDLKTLNRFF
jgi:hypothetical protein